MLLWAFGKTVKTDPGGIPDDFSLDRIQDRESLISNEEINRRDYL